MLTLSVRLNTDQRSSSEETILSGNKSFLPRLLNHFMGAGPFAWPVQSFNLRKLVTVGVCAVILGTASSCTTCGATPDAGIRAGADTVGFGNRAGAPNYYCQPGICQSTGWDDADYRVCAGGYNPATGAAANARKSDGDIQPNDPTPRLIVSP